MIFRTLVVLILVAAVAAWSNKFISRSRSSTTTTRMMSTISPPEVLKGKINVGKQRKINILKERYSGRGELESMRDDEEDDALANSDAFAEADLEEVDPPRAGQTITGTIIEMDDNGALLEIGGKMSGYLPVKEAALIPIKHVNEVLHMGQELTAEVIGTLKGMPVISLRQAQLVTAWESVSNPFISNVFFPFFFPSSVVIVVDFLLFEKKDFFQLTFF